MKKEIKIPDIAENVDSGVIGRILVSKGDKVKKDQPVVEVETDKAATDIPSPFDGTIDEIKVGEGDEVTVGQVIMIVEVAGEGGSDEEDQPDNGEGGSEEEDQPDDGEAEKEDKKDGKKKSAGEKDSGDEQDSGDENGSEGDDRSDKEDADDASYESDEDDGDDVKDDSGEGEAEDDEDEEGDGADESDDDASDDSEKADVEVKEKKAQEKKAQEKASGDDKDSDQEDEQDGLDADGKAGSGKKRAAEDIPAAPSVRRMAREAGIDLSEVKGTGPGKRITSEDIASAKKGKEGEDEEGKKREGKREGTKDSDQQSKEGAPGREGAIELPDFSQWGATKKEKMNTVRRITARTMTAAWQQIPQVTQFDEADITEIEAFRQKHKERYEEKGGNLTVTAILLKISAYALQKFPRFNASLDTSDQTLIMKQYINIGIAVDTDKGLMVPVIRNTDKKSLEEISVETAELARKSREKEISADELQGGNFTISNLGGIGGTAFTPIVYPPQVAILGVSRASYKQVFLEDRFQQRLVLPLTLTYDHRVIDGADGARFLR